MPTIESVFQNDLFPQIYFQLRNGKIFCGVGQASSNKFGVAFVQRDFLANKNQVWHPEIFIEAENLEFPNTQDHFSLLNRKNTPELEEWKNLFTRIALKFEQGTFKKIVPARKVSFDIEGTINPLALFKRVCTTHHYNFFYRKNKNDIFMGSSPERLLSFENKTLHTEAIAGTRTKDRAQELLTSPKDLFEHQLVVEDILQKLNPFARDIQRDLKPQLVESKNLAHLKTFIEAKLEKIDILAILENLHPTSAVCGMPKTASMNFLLKNEGFQREKYAGFLGIMSSEFAEVCVCLRSCQIENQKLHLYSGVGVVPQSNPEQEWQELEDKITPYLRIFGELSKTYSRN